MFKLGFLTALTLLFVGLKLGGVLTWPWIWVLMPIIAPMILGLAALLFALAGAGATAFVVGAYQSQSRIRCCVCLGVIETTGTSIGGRPCHIGCYHHASESSDERRPRSR
jgi:hypothetical protein